MLVSIASMVVASVGLGQAALSPLPIDTLLGAPTFPPVSAPTFAADGQSLAYTVIDNRRTTSQSSDALAWPSETAVPLWVRGGDIWLTKLDGSPARNLTRGIGDNWAPSWSPDGRYLAFLSDRGSSSPAGEVHLWIWERAAGTLHRVNDLPLLDPFYMGEGHLEWTADSRAVVAETYPEGMSPQAYTALLSGDSATHRSSAGPKVTATVYRFDPDAKDSVPQTDQTNLNRWLGDLVLVDVTTGAVRRLSHGQRTFKYALSPNGRLLAWAAARGFTEPGSQEILIDLVVYDLTAGTVRTLVAGAPLTNYPDVLFAWSPTSRAITYRAHGGGRRDQVYVVPVEGGPSRRIADGPVADVPPYEPLLWDSTGRHVFFARAGALWRAAADGTGAARFSEPSNRLLHLIGTDTGELWSPDGGHNTIVITSDPSTKRMGLARVDLGSGAITQLLEEAKWYGGNNGNVPVVTPDGQAMVLLIEDQTHPPDLWLMHGVGAPRPRQVTHIAPELQGFQGGAAQIIAWHGLDGDTFNGALIYPAGYRPGVRYPLIVEVYGGTNLSDNAFRFGSASSPIENCQIFASRGYALLLTDSKLHVGTPMLDLLKSVMPGVERAVELGVADPARLGIMGHSYGGYGALALIVQSHRFKAAVVRAGLGDLIASYGQLSPDGTNYGLSWAESGQGRMGGTPWQYRDRYIENSPIFYLDRVETPVLIIHGDADRGVAPFLTDELFSDLRRLGKRVEYARYPGEGHWAGTWSRPNQLDYLSRVIAWFDRYLKHAGPTH